MDIPIVRWTDPGSGEIKENMVFCTDILDALTQDFFARKGNPIDEPPHVDEIKVNLQLIYFQNFAFLYHFIKEFEKKKLDMAVPLGRYVQTAFYGNQDFSITYWK